MTTIVLDHDVDVLAERLVLTYKGGLELAVTHAQLDVIEGKINAFDSDHPTLYRSLLRRLRKPLVRHRRRVSQGNVAMPDWVKFPQKMVCGDNIALVVDGQGYAFYARKMYVPVFDE